MQCWPGFAEGEKQMLTTSGDNVQCNHNQYD